MAKKSQYDKHSHPKTFGVPIAYLMNNKRHAHCCRTHSWFLEADNEENEMPMKYISYS